MKEHQRLREQIDSLQSKINHLPSGKLICSHTGNHCKWFQSDGHTKIYIPKENRHLAEQLAIKKYLTLLLDDLSHEARALEFYLKHHHEENLKIKQLLLSIPGYQELLAPFFSPRNQELSDWMHASYEHNPKYPEQLIHKASSGNYVRSKSEALIDMFLTMHCIPFRYECALQLGDATFFPDFTIRHPETDQIYYWEHFGLMDDSSYSRNAFSKLQLYATYNIIPSINLITTYETKGNPLSSEIIEIIIKHYFL